MGDSVKVMDSCFEKKPSRIEDAPELFWLKVPQEEGFEEKEELILFRPLREPVFLDTS